uniref:Uncharacterized protein n=1 Tax=Lactuca sativa TaxID=4236 RepID=A0A9R1VE28_LACSA|nr:hypothetical protein LSAT_V11C500281310 [Lactuca sativa]
MDLIDDKNQTSTRLYSWCSLRKSSLPKIHVFSYPKFALDLKSAKLNKVLSFIHHFERSDLMNPRDKPFTITYLIGYALTNNPQDSSWALDIARNKKALGEKLPPRISIDSLHIGEISKSLEPTPRDILKSIRSMFSRVDNLNQTISQLSEGKALRLKNLDDPTQKKEYAFSSSGKIGVQTLANLYVG